METEAFLRENSTVISPQSNQRQKYRRKRPLGLGDLISKCRSAPAVFLALAEESQEAGSSVFGTSRERLYKRTGLSKNTISKALTVLHKSAWIDRVLISREREGQTISLLRIVLRVEPLLPRLLRTKKRYTSRVPKTGTPVAYQKPVHDSSKEEGAHSSPPLSVGDDAPERQNRQNRQPAVDVTVYDPQTTDPLHPCNTGSAVSQDPVTRVPVNLALMQAHSRNDVSEITRLTHLFTSSLSQSPVNPKAEIQQ